MQQLVIYYMFACVLMCLLIDFCGGGCCCRGSAELRGTNVVIATGFFRPLLLLQEGHRCVLAIAKFTIGGI